MMGENSLTSGEEEKMASLKVPTFEARSINVRVSGQQKPNEP